MVTHIADLSSSSKFNWTIENFSELQAACIYRNKAPIYPKGDIGAYDELSLFLCPVDLTKYVYTVFSFAITNHTDPSMRMRRVLWVMQRLNTNSPKKCPGCGWTKFMRLSELHGPNKGYIVNDTCVITVEVTCTTNKESKDDNGLTEESNPNKVAKTENEIQDKEKDDHKSRFRTREVF
ncbi:hypothetical protein MKX01_038460 [Papaver californicum]|nr:hypothetical protein MKX01_038460 [Papaver californicum]